MSKRTREWKRLIKNSSVSDKKSGTFAGMRAMIHRREMYHKEYMKELRSTEGRKWLKEQLRIVNRLTNVRR